ncbi:MAG TPA: polysaccharide deacetylase family protein [Noviherbaspirillum sp.]|jgi:hypothetical protein|uniref:polysaccharide deacetylase family protein n=1 Tax=Noviherbaspirillum sp. TaxID=1926288 RepID=UPI002DDD9FD3|nr:polysaccharide deacetylase family protein [Noviherbaspirillum sp.]HEV2608643.1 polysaccharide deacetylase family protein [Noviherbaspirillum sp.]
MLTITFPDNCRQERSWVSGVLLGEFLGLSHRIQFDAVQEVHIEAAGKRLSLPDDFFAAAKDCWLMKTSLPIGPLRRWTVKDNGLHACLLAPGETSVPVLFGSGGFSRDGDVNAKLQLDIFGSAFFMLSRYEEAVCERRDAHDRFPASASLAHREGFLHRPIVDEYVEILWSAIAMLWPQLERKTRQHANVVTCDVDHPYHPSAASLPRLFRRTAAETLRKRTLAGAMAPLKNYLASRKGNWKNDPYYPTVDWMMDVNERAGNTVAFYFIPEITDSAMDGECAIAETAVRAMMRRIAERGHEIGIHPGYRTYRSMPTLISGLGRLRRILEEERIPQPVMGGRQHYLRWITSTPGIWDSAGLAYDSTLGYADHTGFRCGTCHEYTMFDLHSRTALNLKQRPLVCMDRSITAYMGGDLSASTLPIMKALKDATRRFNGNFTLLWHNSCFETDQARQTYCEIISP